MGGLYLGGGGMFGNGVGRGGGGLFASSTDSTGAYGGNGRYKGSSNFGSGGYGGGDGASSYGAGGASGAGAGFGGSIFIMNGTTTLNDVSFSSNTVTAGAGYSNGQAKAKDIFICTDGTGSTLTHDPLCTSSAVKATGSTHTTEIIGSFIATPSTTDSDATLTAGSSVNEPIDLPTTADTLDEAVNLFDFKITDGGGGLSTDVTQLVIHTSGTGGFSKVTWRLNGVAASHVVGVYDAGANTLTFSELSISIADNTTETYTLNGFFNDNSSITDNNTYLFSIDGASDAAGGSDVTVDPNKTQMAADGTAT